MFPSINLRLLLAAITPHIYGLRMLAGERAKMAGIVIIVYVFVVYGLKL
jgi:hypothetical protein